MAEHDTGYKELFSHAEMVADLIRGFVHEDWVRDLDFSSLERVPSEFITPRLHRRGSDIIWRFREGWKPTGRGSATVFSMRRGLPALSWRRCAT